MITSTFFNILYYSVSETKAKSFIPRIEIHEGKEEDNKHEINTRETVEQEARRNTAVCENVTEPECPHHI